jgi:methyltransferase (TIGR00027 family)
MSQKRTFPRPANRACFTHTEDVDSDVASTARVTAALRAGETARADALFQDPWAAVLAGPGLLATFAAQPPDIQSRAASYTIIRTRVFDDWLLATDCPHIVLLGAGFDTRAFRLRWPAGTQVWELDQAEVLNAKEVAMGGVPTRSGCTRRTVAVDLANEAWPTALATAGFRSEVPTAWLAEGVLPYLQPRAVETLVRLVSELSAPGSKFAADFVSTEFMAARNAYVATVVQPLNSAAGAVFRYGTNDPAALLSRHGWGVTSVQHPGDEDADFGRWVGPQNMGAGFFFVKAVRSWSREVAGTTSDASG